MLVDVDLSLVVALKHKAKWLQCSQMALWIMMEQGILQTNIWMNRNKSKERYLCCHRDGTYYPSFGCGRYNATLACVYRKWHSDCLTKCMLAYRSGRNE
jgi:hypothetical protein